MNATNTRVRRPGRGSRKLTVLELLIMATCLAILVGVFLNPGASGQSEEIPATAVRVRESQTLWDLARVHPVDGLSTAQTVELIRSINDMEQSALTLGQVVYVPAEAQGNSASLASR